ncbi:MAG: ABC transporter permease subunit [Desulfurococcales archaeon]|nr:ABC transporter permease subunit [Desulfurococcales archaeon]
MRWVVIKLINLVIVLVVVTYLVAAIFTGPLAEREKSIIYTEVRNSVRGMFQNVNRGTIYYNCISRVGLVSFNESVDRANSLLKTPQNLSKIKSFSNITDNNTKYKIIDAVGEGIKEAVAYQLKKIGKLTEASITLQASKIAEQILAQEGINVTNTTIKEVASKYHDVLSMICRNKIVEDEIHRRIVQKGLDKPWYVLSLKYTKMLLKFQPPPASVLTTRYWPSQGDRNTLHIIIERLPYSISLFTTSSILTLLLATPLALYAARRPNGLTDHTITWWSIFSVSMPWWWLAMVFIYLFTIKYHIFPSPFTQKPQWGSMFELKYLILPGGPSASTILHGLWTIVKASALPVFTVTILSIGDTAFRMRNILLDVFNEDFVTVARAKGVPEHIVLRRHVLRPAAPPLVTIVLFAIVLSVFSGAIITELIFNWYGLGRLYWDAIQKSDIPVVLELTYITTLLYLILRFILDILYTYLDPRIRRA